MASWRQRRLRLGAPGSYRYWGLIGTWVGIVTMLAVTLATRGSPVFALVVAGACIASFGIAVKLSFIVFGHERIVFYEQTLAALGLTWAVLAATGRPVLAGLDLAMIGIGTFLVFGRLGCLLAGCCHGRPARRGVRYPAQPGFATHLVGVRLFPLQLVEAALSALLVVLAIVLVALGSRPGAAVVAYLVVYGVVRFGLELARGDEARPVGWGLSEAQWTAVLIGWFLGWRLGGGLWWGYGAALSVGALVVVLLSRRRSWRWRRSWLRLPRHTRQLSEVLAALAAQPGIATGETRFGLRISSSLNKDGSRHLALSRLDPPALEPHTAALLTREIALLLDATASTPLAGRTPGLFHVDLVSGAESMQIGARDTSLPERVRGS